MTESPSEKENGNRTQGKEKESGSETGCIFDVQLLQTMPYIYYEDMRLTCDEPSSESVGPCASRCPVAFEYRSSCGNGPVGMWPKVVGAKV